MTRDTDKPWLIEWEHKHVNAISNENELLIW